MSDWRWLREDVVLAVHEEQLAEHGGRSGIRDLGLLRSALARPQHLATYAAPDLFDLAAAYAYGIANNHPFVDGNKRTAFVAAALFLFDHGRDITTDDAEKVRVMFELADRTITEGAFAAWLRANTVPVDPVKGGPPSR